MTHSLVRACLTVVAFWWVTSAAWTMVSVPTDWDHAWRATGSVLLLAAIGLFVGPAWIWLHTWASKRAQRALLEGDSVRGLTCTIGPLPLLARESSRAPTLPDFAEVPDTTPDFYPTWLAKYGQTHPSHAALMRALLQIYEHHRALPATHIPGGHGGRTLLQHSLLAGYYMDKLARTWSYRGLRDRSGKRVVLKLRDEAFVFNPHDPLVAIIGVAHDIGKIEAYIFDERNPSEIVGINHEHDLTGARMIARLPESWGIPDADRQAMFLAIAHYHHPMELPLSPDRRAIDDRTIALMELLIKADFVISRVEAKAGEPTEQDYEESGRSAATDVPADQLYQAFVDLITEHGRINSSDPRFNVATLCLGDGFTKPMLLLKEDSLRPALMRKLGIPSASVLGDGRYQLTIDLLKKLDERGVLYRTHQGSEYSAENALWNVDFMSRPAAGAKPEKRSGWSAVIIVDPKEHHRIEQMEPYWWYAVIQRATMGSARAIHKLTKLPKPHRGRQVDLLDAARALSVPQPAQTLLANLAAAAPSLTAAVAPSNPDPVPPRSEASTQAGHSPTPSAPVVAPSDSHRPHVEPESYPWDDAPAGIQPQQSPQVAAEPATPANPQQSPEPTRAIAPIDVKAALTSLMTRASEQALSLRELNGQYVVSQRTLDAIVPEVDWGGCAYKIEQMCRAGTLDAGILKMADGSFVLTFSKPESVQADHDGQQAAAG